MKEGIGAKVPPFRVMDVITKANERERLRVPGGSRILRMEAGQPGTGLPEGARRAVSNALQSGDAMGYTEAMGRFSLRTRIAAHIQDWYGVNVSPSRIAVTVGASG